MTNEIPFNFRARDYQVEFLRQVQRSIEGRSDKRYFMQIWHRRSGKDKTCIADIAPRRLIKDPCLVKYVYPTLVMGRDNMWDGIGKDGYRYLNHIPDFIRSGAANETRMQIPIVNGSIFQVAGSDNPDSLRGGNAKMNIFSEWSDHDPYAWDVIEPILRENDGISVFNMTPRGDNHARSMYEYAKDNPKWYVQLLTAKDTKVFTEQELEEIQEDIIKRYAADGRSESEARAYFDQEYMCSFTSPVIGSYYGESIRRAETENRITTVPIYEGANVNTAWDLGIDDSMTIWFYQTIANQIRLVDYYENSGEGLAHYAKVLQDKGYLYGKHTAPFDIAVRELGTGKSRLEVARGLGIKFDVAPNLSIEDGVSAVRSMFSECWFDANKCVRGINALKNYKKDWDEKNKVFRNNPKHDWSSHGADAFRVLAIGQKQERHYKQPTSFGGIGQYIPGVG